MNAKVLQKILSILGFILAISLLYFAAKNIGDFGSIIKNAGIAGPLVAIALYGILAPTPIATDPITIVCGAMYGPVYGTLIAWVGNNLAAMVEYYIGKHISQNTDFEDKRKKLPLGLGKLPIDSVLVLTFGRMIPFYGSKIISLLAGIYGVSIRRYLWTSALVNFTGAVMMAYGGFKLMDVFKML